MPHLIEEELSCYSDLFFKAELRQRLFPKPHSSSVEG